jgi:hypothetical protein
MKRFFKKHPKLQCLLDKYTCNSNPFTYKYLAIDFGNKVQSSGLIDTLNQFNSYLRFAHTLNLKLIQFTKPLQTKHNEGKESNFVFSDYFNVNSITINGESASIIQDKSSLNPNEILTIKALKHDEPKGTVKDGLDLSDFKKSLSELELAIEYDPNKKYVDFATNFIKRHNFEGCVHIRRGDRVKVGAPPRGIPAEEWDLATRSKNILNFLDARKHTPKSIYIMTDMKSDDKIISELRESNDYNFTFLYDDKELVSLKEKDNYKAFHQEQCIQNSDLIKFKTDRFDLVYFYKNQNDLP